MIVTMDGPAGAGKSSIARMLATRLGFDFLDTGAMYRCVTLACLQRGVDFEDNDAIAHVAESIIIEFNAHGVFMNGQDVTTDLRTPEVTRSIRPIADNTRVRQRMVALQQAWAGHRDVVTEGRDQGTVAFPKAECKIYLTAAPEERARRRVAQLEAQGQIANFREILELQSRRDAEDSNRPMGPLRMADDASYVATDGMTEEAVVDQLVELVRSRLPATPS